MISRREANFQEKRTAEDFSHFSFVYSPDVHLGPAEVAKMVDKGKEPVEATDIEKVSLHYCLFRSALTNLRLKRVSSSFPGQYSISTTFRVGLIAYL